MLKYEKSTFEMQPSMENERAYIMGLTSRRCPTNLKSLPFTKEGERGKSQKRAGRLGLILLQRSKKLDLNLTLVG